MTYYEKLTIIKNSLIKKIKEIITNHHYKPMFELWLSYDADIELGYNYIGIFNEHFGDHITEEVENRLWFAGKNVLYVIKSFIYINNNKYQLEKLLAFVEIFVSEQLKQFENDYSDYECYNWSTTINKDGIENVEEEEPEENEMNNQIIII